jgi:hypothetical protein
MSYIISPNLQHYFLALNENIQAIFSTNDSLLFSLKIRDSIKILSFLFEQFSSKKNILGSPSFSPFLLAQILSFLPSYSLKGLRSISKHWWRVLQISSIQNCIGNLKYKSCPKGLTLLKSWNVSHMTPTGLWLIGNKLFIWIEAAKVIQSWTTTGHYLDEFPLLSSNINFLSVSNKYISYVQDDLTIHVLNHENKIVQTWPIFGVSCNGFTLNQENVYLIAERQMNIFSIKGIKKSSWSMESKSTSRQNLTIYENKIWIINFHENFVSVYTQQGVPLLRFGNYGHNIGELYNPWGIKVTSNLIFITDSSNNRIQAFTHEGKFCFLFNLKPSNTDLAEICILDDLLFSNDWKDNKIFVFKIEYQNRK